MATKESVAQYFLSQLEEFNKYKIELDSQLTNCVSKKIPRIGKQHPEWSNDQIVAVAHSKCNKNIKDAIVIGTPRVRAGKIVRNIKSKKGLKVGHMGLNPMKAELPMKNPNKLQTKLEELFTEESKYLTMEEEERRSKYATLMKKSDATLEEAIDSILQEYPEATDEEVIIILDFFYGDSVELFSDSYITDGAIFDSINTGLNNIIKINVTLAKEGVQPYYKPILNDNGEIQYDYSGKPKVETKYHFKSYPILKDAIMGIEKLPIILEHQDFVNEENTLGCVRNLRADDSTLSIKGIAYLIESKLPKFLSDALKKKVLVPVSIGFFTRLGTSGTYLGQYYDHIQEGIILNHLAICIDSIARCKLPDCGLNVDSIDGKFEGDLTFIKKENNYFNIDNNFNKKLDLKETKKEKLSKTQIGGNMAINEKDSVQQTFSAVTPKDLEAFISSLHGFLNGIVVEDRSQIIDRVLGALKDSNLYKQGDSKNMSITLTKEELAELISQSVKAATTDVSGLKDSFGAFLAEHNAAKAKIEEEKNAEKYLKQIKKYSKIGDAFLKDKSVEQLKLLADSLISLNPSSAQPEKPEFQTDSHRDGNQDIKLADGTLLTKDRKIKWEAVFDSVNEDFELGGISFCDPDAE